METIGKRNGRRWIVVAAVALAVVAGALAWWNVARTREGQNARKGSNAISVTTARVEKRDVPVRLRSNGTVTAVQSVDIRAQVTSTVRTVHIHEGQNVRAGELLFSLDARAEEAALRKAQAQVAKDMADLEVATRNLDRQRELFAQKFISQSALDTAQNVADALNGQLAVDRAAMESAKVAQAYTEIRASFAGRTGVIGVRPGSLVQPGGAVLVTVTQIDPITVAFTLPEKELAGLQAALAAGEVPVRARAEGAPDPFDGKLIFVDNAVDSATATIRVKAAFANPNARLWPGMFVNVSLAPRTLPGASVVPAQAVQTGPDNQFVYVVDQAGKVAQQPVTLAYVETGFAVVNGVEPGVRVVVEGAQNLRPGSLVTEAERKGQNKGNDKSSEPGKNDITGEKSGRADTGGST
jgi:RND family efflux transporter MFP subunit